MNRYQIGTEPVPGYRILEFLGEGSYGAVYKARGPGGVENAMKFISLDNKQGLKEFKSVSLVKKLRHANLVPIFAIWLRDSNGNVMDETSGGDSGSINLMGNKELVIAMSLGDRSLSQALEETRGRGIPAVELLRYMDDAAKGIDYLNKPVHEPGGNSSIIHCDIKPGNLLIVGDSVQVCDYGVAKALSKKLDLKKTMGAGTPAYAAPELINNDPTTQTDQYSLAITYIELRTGLLPFEESKALVSNLMGQLDLSRLTPPEAEVIRQATHKQPAKRFENCQAMVEALKVAAGISLGRTGAVPMSSTRRPQATEEFQPHRTLDDLLQKGQMLVPEHRLVRRLGEGGYGQVWEARDNFDTPCALKVVRRTENRGQGEFEILSKIKNIKHKHLMDTEYIWLLAADGSRVRSEQIGQPGAAQPAAVVIKTKLADKNLFQRMRECQQQGMDGIAPTELMVYMHQSAAAIDHLNNNNVQHRDIKPENILLMADQAYVSDFGLAKLVDDSGNAVQSSSSGMTLDYAAPELLDEKRVTMWTDQYSLALTYIMLRTGRLPYPPHASQTQKIQARLSGDLDLSGVSPAEREVLRIALDRDPGRRYDSCGVMASRLGSAVGVGSGPLGLTGSGPQPAFTGSGTYPPMPPRSSSNLGRTSGVVDQANPRTSSYPQEMQVIVDTADYSYTPARGVMGTVGFGGSDTSPMSPQRPAAPPENVWKKSGFKAGTEPPSDGWKNESTAEKKKSSKAGPILAGLMMLLAAGGAGWYFLVYKNGDSKSIAKNEADTVKPDNDSKQPKSDKKPIGNGDPKSDDPPKVDPPPVKPTDQTFVDQLQQFSKAWSQGQSPAQADLDKYNNDAEQKHKDWLAGSEKAFELLRTPPADAEKLLARDAEFERAAEKLPEAIQKTVRELYSAKLGGWITALIPKLETGNWAGLAKVCEKAKDKPSDVIAECWIEAKLSDQAGSFEKPASIQGSSPYAKYLQIVDCLTSPTVNSTKPASEIGKLLAATMPPELAQSPRRKTRLLQVISSAMSASREPASKLPADQELLGPYSEADAAMVASLGKTADALMAAGGELPALQAAKLKHDLLLAFWTKPGDNAEAISKLAAEVVKSDLVTELKDTHRARLLVIHAQSRGKTEADRKEAIKSYRDLIAINKQSPSAMPPSIFAKWVLEPLTADPFSESLLTLAAGNATRTDAATLLASTADRLRTMAAKFDQAKASSESALSLCKKLYDRAAKLSGNAKHYAWAGIVDFQATDKNPKDALALCENATDKSGSAVAVAVLRGLVAFSNAKTDDDYMIRFKESAKAVAAFSDVVANADPAKDAEELQLSYRYGAASGIRYANYGHKLTNPEKDKALAQAAKWARLGGGSPEMLDVLGCALEDMAFIARNSKRLNESDEDGTYQAAASVFRKAMNQPATNDSGLGILSAVNKNIDSRTRAKIHLGRCLYRWADDLWTSKPTENTVRQKAMALAKESRAEIQSSLEQLRTASFERGEGKIFLGKLLELEASFASGSKAEENLREAESQYRSALDDAREPGAADCRPFALLALVEMNCRRIEGALRNDSKAKAENLARSTLETVVKNRFSPPSEATSKWHEARLRAAILNPTNVGQEGPAVLALVEKPGTLKSHEQFVLAELKLIEARVRGLLAQGDVKKYDEAKQAFLDAAKMADEQALPPESSSVFYAEYAIFLWDIAPAVQLEKKLTNAAVLDFLKDSKLYLVKAILANPESTSVKNWKEKLLFNFALPFLLPESPKELQTPLNAMSTVVLYAELVPYWDANISSVKIKEAKTTAQALVASRLEEFRKLTDDQTIKASLKTIIGIEIDLLSGKQPSAESLNVFKSPGYKAKLESELKELSPIQQLLHREQYQRLIEKLK